MAIVYVNHFESIGNTGHYVNWFTLRDLVEDLQQPFQEANK